LCRFEGTGKLTTMQATLIGAVGMAARSSGMYRDIRWSHPFAAYAGHPFEPVMLHKGDVWTRAMLRKLEVVKSIEVIRELIKKFTIYDLRFTNEYSTTQNSEINHKPEIANGISEINHKPEIANGISEINHKPEIVDRKSEIVNPIYDPTLAPSSLAISLVEGWRGEICHIALTDNAGEIIQYKAKDPSLHNWMALALAVRNQEISDFPLCNKSFNLSYCGNDL
jgi:Ni,Fe-hydrogenase III large subunit